MSDEEKKAIEVLQYVKNKTPFIFWYEDKPYNRKETINTILNLIEKQTKEIEELKTQIDEQVYYDLGGRSCGKTELLRHYKKGYDMNNKFWKDKIKAKIEEYEKMKEATKMDITYYGEKRRSVIEGLIAELQSILEKE